MKKIGKNGLLPAGIIITGGGSGIATIEDLAKATLKLPSKIAMLGGNAKDCIKDSTWSVAYGLCVLGLSQDESEALGVSQSNVSSIIKKGLSFIKHFLP